MAEDNALVIVAGYQDLDSARHDFDTLTGRADDKSVALQGAVLVGKDSDGNPVLVDTGNQLGRRGAKWGAGVGLAVGLFSPGLLATAAVGAAAGALAGTFANHRIKSGLADKIGQAMSAGSAMIIAVTPAQGRLPVGQALAGSPMKSVAELSRSTLRSLGAALQEAMGKFNPDRTRLPLPQRSFGGTIGRTMADSVGDWSIVPGPFPPDDAPNVLIVLIDDAGFGGPDTFGGAIRTPTLTRVAQNGLAYNRFHVTAVCSPTRAVLLTGRNHHRVGFGSVCEFPGPSPGYSTVKPNSCAALPRILRDNGYVTGAFGKWHLTPDNVQGAAGPFDNWPLGWGFDHFWGFPSGAAGQYDPVITQDNTVTGVPHGKDGKTKAGMSTGRRQLNGRSSSGSFRRTPNSLSDPTCSRRGTACRRQLELIEQYGGIEALGDEFTAPHFASGWAHANNAPFQWGKQMASHLGGARDPMVVAWPSRIRPDGRVRSQFTHCIDIAPTVLEAIGLPVPASVDGFEQEPMDGTSFVHTFDDGAAEERHTVQYFEMFGSRAIYKDGWWACARTRSPS